MAYTAPTTRSTGDVVTATIWNTDMVDNIKWLKALPLSRAHYQHKLATTNDGGTATSGSWGTRPINTELADPDSIAALSSNQVTPIAGTYFMLCHAAFYGVNKYSIRWYNATATATVLQGMSQIGGDGPGLVAGVFTANGTDAYEVQYYCSTTNADDGLGADLSDGADEVFLNLFLIKIA